MRCIYPPIEHMDENDDTDWFCPYCETMANLLLKVQMETNRILRNDDDDEWERRRYIRYQQQQKKEKAANKNKKKDSPTKMASIVATTANDDDDHDSLKSWENVHMDVFPEAEWEYDVVQRLKKQRGLRNHIDIEILLARIQGQDEQRVIALYQQHGTTATADVNGGGVDDPMNNNADDDNDDDDDDDLDIDGNFDLYSYQEERRISRADLDKNDDDDSNSQVTLGELSVVELQVSDDELAALTDVDSDDESDDDDDQKKASKSQSSPPRRLSRRLRDKQETYSKNTNAHKKQNSHSNGTHNSCDDTGRMDVANIITGKRKRFAIDYCKLNDAMFHSVPASELDDDDDFIYTDPYHHDTTTTATTTATTVPKATRTKSSPTKTKKQRIVSSSRPRRR